MIAFKRTFTDAMPGRIEGGLEKAGITVLHGEARFTGRDKIEVNGEILSSRNFHIATGARPMTLNIPGEELLATSTDFLSCPNGRTGSCSSAADSLRWNLPISPNAQGRGKSRFWR